MSQGCGKGGSWRFGEHSDVPRGSSISEAWLRVLLRAIIPWSHGPQPAGAEAGLVARLLALLAPSLVLQRVALTACALTPESFPALCLLPRCLQAARLVRAAPPPATVRYLGIFRSSD